MTKVVLKEGCGVAITAEPIGPVGAKPKRMPKTISWGRFVQGAATAKPIRAHPTRGSFKTWSCQDNDLCEKQVLSCHLSLAKNVFHLARPEGIPMNCLWLPECDIPDLVEYKTEIGYWKCYPRTCSKGIRGALKWTEIHQLNLCTLSMEMFSCALKLAQRSIWCNAATKENFTECQPDLLWQPTAFDWNSAN